MKVSHVAEMRNLDHQAVERYGIPAPILMENAGEAAYYVILRALGVKGKRFVVFCGSGHNGGDGMVVARKLYSSGGLVQIFCLGRPEKFDEVVGTHYKMVARMPIEFVRVTEENLGQIDLALREADAVVDAIFGTGLSREVGGIYRQVIQRVNDSGKAVFSIDIPSGVNGDTGRVMGVAVQADHTITFGLPKIGSMLYPGFALGGRLTLTHISFPPELYQDDALQVALSLPAPLPIRPRDAHKGSYGKVLFVAGAARYVGAPYFAALSFLKAGGGLSYLATPRSIAPFIANKGSEIVFLPQAETGSGSLALSGLDGLLAASRDVNMVVLGPGLSLDEETQQLARALVAQVEKPLLIDGDGLTAIAGLPGMVRARRAPTVLTPHPGEMARLTQLSVAEIQAQRVDVLQKAVADWNAHIVLKGAHSLIGYPDGRVFINLSGNPGMATAGSGDVLTGSIAAMFCSGFAWDEAVRMGVFVHGLAGDLAARDLGEDGMLAGDILAHLPAALRHWRAHQQEMVASYYDSLQVM